MAGEHPVHIETIPPGSRVAVFLGDSSSQATIGYHGTLLGICPGVMGRNPRSPRSWQYYVELPTLGRVIEVAAVDLLVACDHEGRTVMVAADSLVRQEDAFEPREVQFFSPVEDDNEELYGRYRFGMSERGAFYFKKRDQRLPAFQLRLRGQLFHRSRVRIYYDVPSHERLDREFVMNALADVIGCPRQ
jgi:hypothetical protein